MHPNSFAFHALVLISLMFTTSCATSGVFKTYHFAPIHSIQDIEGRYVNHNERDLLSLFRIKNESDFITITSVSANEINLSYHIDSTIVEHIFTGTMKGNYFEIYFLNRRTEIPPFLPLFYTSYDIDRLRIGKSNDGKLLIWKYVNSSGSVFVFGGGFRREDPYLFEEVNYK
jgi:hypothetical protein